MAQNGPLADPCHQKALFQFGSLLWDRPVQRTGNTRCEFNLNCTGYLDKIPNWQHALVTHHTTPSTLGPAGRNRGWTMKFMMGLLAAVVLLASMGSSHAV